MKIKALSRSVSEYNPPGTEVVKQPRNLDPGAHPFERARESVTRGVASPTMFKANGDHQIYESSQCSQTRAHARGALRGRARPGPRRRRLYNG